MEYCAYCGNPTGKVSYAPCPKCGNPTNGAPRPAPAAAGGGTNTALIVIFAVVGALVLVAIIGILAAIAVPNLLTAKQRAMQKRTMADIRMIATAAEAYATDNNGVYPETLAVLAPKYIKVVPTRDGWGHQFEYECLTDETGKCTGYVILSGGKNGHPDDSMRELAAHPRGATTNFDCDIVYSNGTFVEYPEGVQH